VGIDTTGQHLGLQRNPESQKKQQEYSSLANPQGRKEQEFQSDTDRRLVLTLYNIDYEQATHKHISGSTTFDRMPEGQLAGPA
jgi:hypothetical protein